MAARREPNRRNEDEGDSWGFWGGLAAVVGAIGVGIAAAGAVAAMSDNTTNTVELEGRRTRTRTSAAERRHRRESKHKQLVLAVDATPGRGGALLVSSHNKEIRYYSVNWKNHFKFSQDSHRQTPDIFELTNAVLAMTVFRPVIQQISKYYEYIVVKIDNTAMNSSKLFLNDPLRVRARALIAEIKGGWAFVQKKSDNEMKIANWLSRNPENLSQYTNVSIYYPDYKYSRLELSNSSLKRIKEFVPKQFCTEDDDSDDEENFTYIRD